MYDFRDVAAASKTEQIRAWSVEQAIDILRHDTVTKEEVVSMATSIEDYVLNGKKDDD